MEEKAQRAPQPAASSPEPRAWDDPNETAEEHKARVLAQPPYDEDAAQQWADEQIRKGQAEE